MANLDCSEFIGEVVRVTWCTGHVGISKIIEDSGECLLTSEHLFQSSWTRPSLKNKDHIDKIEQITKH